MKPRVFISVGTPNTTEQKEATEAIFRSIEVIGLDPRQMNKNEWSFEQPLRAIRNVMTECDGVVVVAFTRSKYRCCTDGSDSVNLPTVWNQIEAAMGYMQDIPLLIIAERGLREEGLLEGKYDWKIFRTAMNNSKFQSDAYLGVLGSWKDAVITRSTASASVDASAPDISNISIGKLISSLSIPQLWKLISAVAVVLIAVATTAFLIGSGRWPWG